MAMKKQQEIQVARVAEDPKCSPEGVEIVCLSLCPIGTLPPKNADVTPVPPLNQMGAAPLHRRKNRISLYFS